MTVLSINSQLHCQINRHTQAWKMGTGLKISLEPGIYQITAEEHFDGVRYFTLEDAFRIDERDLLTNL